MTLLTTTWLLLGWLFLMSMPQKPSLKPVRIITCTRIANPDPKLTSLACSQGEKGEELILDFPETYVTFPKGDVFKIEILADGSSRFAAKQPKGSVVILSPPCPKDNPCVDGRRKQAPCNLELPRS